MLQDYEWISFSAPTSAGKSFILYQWVINKLKNKKYGDIVIIVPTRALITQCSNDLRELISKSGLKNEVFNVPGEFDSSGANCVYVYTQERLYQHMVHTRSQSGFSLIIVDEAHKVSDAQRGVFLQLTLERVITSNKRAQFVFSSPLTDNPGKLLRSAPTGATAESMTGYINTVNQNLVWVAQVERKPTRWKLLNVADDEVRDIGRLELDYGPRKPRDRFASVAYKLGGGRPGNVVYVNGPNEAEQISHLLVLQIGGQVEETDELINLSNAIRKTIHPNYMLARFVRSGVAFHYGVIPQNIRDEIERLFRNGQIKYLVATSTLVEGVNLACRNIFLRGPKTGNEPMGPGDFWNLAGRAGRWGKEFQGNIICVDPYWTGLWAEGEPPRERTKFSIYPKAEVLLRDPTRIIDFIDKGGIARRVGDKDAESVWHYLCAQYIEFGDLDKSFAGLYLREGWAETLQERVSATLTSCAVSWANILRNPGISVNAMDEIYQWFVLEVREGRSEELIPPPPTSDDAVRNYARLFNIMKRRMGAVNISSGSREPGDKDNRAMQVAILSANWMQGMSLPNIIDRKIKYEKRRKRKVDENSTIRDTMKDIEQCVRFEVPKYLSAYVDILYQCFQDYGVEIEDMRLDDLSERLEFGVATKTELSLIALGASRSAAMMAAPYLRAEELGKEEVRDALRKIDWRITDIPELIRREIVEVVWGHEGE
ncbi:Helicase conserved C-terminal domain-containing protein [Limimonas halophila]|uniref:Helicase conserved C-terminal domain-containing protein n=2 Tax=Limimonas halophila TaxID=1082479 RepID=A0A1G7SQA1_9PROT|nr:Helicase conserved C-terminal domain-containing protein [Limimonas halophila]